MSAGIAILALGLSLVAVGSGRAQSTLGPEAEKAFRRGVVAAEQGQWTVAVRSFEEARKAAPQEPGILFNLGLAESKLPGRELRATAWLRAYLAANARAGNAKAVRELIEALDVRLEGTLDKILRQSRDLALQIPAGYDRNGAVQKVAETQVAMGDFAGARETVARMSPDDSSGPGWVARALAKAGDVAGAKQMVAGIKKDDYHIYRSSAYVDIAATQARSGDLAGAEATLGEVKREDDRVGGFFAVAGVLWEAGRKAEAAAWVTRGRDAVAGLPPSSRAGHYPRLGQMQASVDDVAAALQTASLLPEDKRADVLVAVGQAYRRRFDERLAAGDLAEARRLATSLTPAARSGAYVALYKNRLAAGDWDESLRALNEVADTDSDKARGYAELARALLGAGDRARARQVLAQAASRLGRMTNVYDLAGAHTAAGDFDGARRVIALLKGDKQAALHWFALAQADAGDLAGAKQTLAGMQKDSWYDQTVVAIAKRELAGGDIAAALQTFAAMSNPKGWPYREIATAQLAAGDIAGALRHAASIADADYRAWMYRDIAAAQLELGQLDAALATVQLIPKPDLALWYVARRQADHGDFAGAVATANRITDQSTRLNVYVYDIAPRQLRAGYGRAATATATQLKAMVEGMKDPTQQFAGYSSLQGSWLNLGSLGLARQAVAGARGLAGSAAVPAKRVELLNQLAGLERSAMLWTESRQSRLLALEAAASMPPSDALESAYKAIAGLQMLDGDIAGARETVSRVSGEEDRGWALALLTSTHRGAGNVAALRELIATVTASTPRQYVQRELAQLLAQQGDRAGVAQIATAYPPGAYGRDEVFQALALVHAKAGDLAAARTAVAQLREPIRTGDLFVAIARAGDLSWAEQNLRLIHDDSREIVRGQLAGLRASSGDLGAATALLARSVSLRAKAAVCEGMVSGGDVRAVSECAAKLPTAVLRIPVLFRLAEVRAERGDRPGALAILDGLRSSRPGADLLLKVATAQVAIGDDGGARQTLELIHPNDGEFEPWAQYVVATAQPATKLAHAVALARAMAEPSWRDRALLALLPRITDPATADTLLAAVSDPLARSRGRLELLRRDLKERGVASALKQVPHFTDVEARALALGEIAASGRPEARGPAVAQAATSLPDGAAKVYLLLDLAGGRLGTRDAAGAVALMRAAEGAVRAMADSFWQARAYADMAELAARAGATSTAEAAKRLARATADRLSAPDKVRWQAAVNRPPADQEVAEIRAARAAQERAKKWIELIEWRLKDAPFTDLTGHLQSVTGQAKSKDLVEQLIRAADALIGASKEIKAVADQP